jgi:hypothetical protein
MQSWHRAGKSAGPGGRRAIRARCACRCASLPARPPRGSPPSRVASRAHSYAGRRNKPHDHACTTPRSVAGARRRLGPPLDEICCRHCGE